VTEALGQPIRFQVTGGQIHDVTQAEALLADLPSEYVIGDRGYASAALWTQIEAGGAIPVIPPHPRSHTDTWYDRHLYKARHVVECFFNKLKHYRRVFARFDKLAVRFLSFVHFAATLIWLR
jgi:transposase